MFNFWTSWSKVDESHLKALSSPCCLFCFISSQRGRRVYSVKTLSGPVLSLVTPFDVHLYIYPLTLMVLVQGGWHRDPGNVYISPLHWKGFETGPQAASAYYRIQMNVVHHAILKMELKFVMIVKLAWNWFVLSCHISWLWWQFQCLVVPEQRIFLCIIV